MIDEDRDDRLLPGRGCRPFEASEDDRSGRTPWRTRAALFGGLFRGLVVVKGEEDVIGGSDALALPDTLDVPPHPASTTQNPMTRLRPILRATPLTVRLRSRSTERRARCCPSSSGRAVPSPAPRRSIA